MAEIMSSNIWKIIRSLRTHTCVHFTPTTMLEKDKPTSTIEHLEHAVSHDSLAEKASLTEVHVAALDGDGLVKSRFDTLTIPQALWVFRRSLAVCFAVFTGRMLEYFEIVMCGSILANPGFIRHFGEPGATGVAALDPNWGEWRVMGHADGSVGLERCGPRGTDPDYVLYHPVSVSRRGS